MDDELLDETTVRECAMSMPPSDFGSTRAIRAAAKLIADEREECARIIDAARGEGSVDLRTLAHRIRSRAHSYGRPSPAAEKV